MRILLNKAHFPVTVLGPGRRIGLWLQGCSIGCAGCISRDTWSADMALATEVESVLDWCRSLGDASPDGVTISGGEPFDQPEALAALLVGLHAWRAIAARPLDILCYSGYPLRVLRTRYAHVLTMLDAVVPGPFVVDRPSADPMIGSENQRVLALSPLGNERYGSGTSEKRSPRLQMNVTDTVVWLIGIPKRGDLDAMASACADRGVILKGMSWRA